MKLGFFRSKITKEQIEKQAQEELEAAMARAKPPTDAERTWFRSERSEPLPSWPADTAPSATEGGDEVAPAAEAYGPGVVVEDEPLPGAGVEGASYEAGEPSDEEGFGWDVPAAPPYGPGVVVEDEATADRADEEDELAPAAPARRPRAASTRSRTAPPAGTTRSRSDAGKAPAAKPTTRSRAATAGQGRTGAGKGTASTSRTTKSGETRSRSTTSTRTSGTPKSGGRARKA